MTSLTPQRFEQRLADLEGAFRRLGDVAIARGSEGPQTVLITIDHPGWGAPRRAHMRFVETWQRDGDSWKLVRYAYDLLADPGPGRFGFHWHDGTHHTHCVDEEAPNKDHHHRGAPIDPTVESRAAHLLIDGHKRTGALLAADGRPRFSDTALVALALLVAESAPAHKDLVIRLVLNLLAEDRP